MSGERLVPLIIANILFLDLALNYRNRLLQSGVMTVGIKNYRSPIHQQILNGQIRYARDQ